jgi:predicted GIY-YIG superfamily endonuclease
VLRDRLLARLSPGQAPDYQQLACEVLGIRGATPALARSLVEAALVFEDRREHWRRVGERARREAPAAPGVYVFRDWSGTVLYVGKAANLRRRLRAHFENRRWRMLPPALAGVAAIEWQQAGSEIEALLREALLIRDLQPVVNVQTAAPALATRAIPCSLVRDVVLLVPSIDPDAVELVAAREDGATMLQRTRRSGAELARHSRKLWTFFVERSHTDRDGSAPLVFSWLAGRGQHTTRLNPCDSASARHLRIQLGRLLADRGLFSERLISVPSDVKTSGLLFADQNDITGVE